MAIEFCITHWQGIRRSAQGGVPSGWSQSVVTLRGVPAEIDGWGDMGLFAPSRCVEVVSRVVGGTPHGCEMFGVQVGTVHTVKAAGSRRNRMVGVGYVETYGGRC